MKIKFQKIFAVSFGIMFLPLAVFGASTEWGVGATVTPNGDLGLSVGIGSRGSGAGDVWGSGFGGGWSLVNPYGLPQGSILGIVSNLLFWLLAIFGIAGIVGFIISGIIYLVSAGDDDTIERAKTAMKYSIVGILVGLSGFVIMQAVAMLLSGASNRF